MANDGFRTPIKGFQVGLDVLSVFSAQAFGRELDRRQRVLDLVGDAAGDVLPGGVALRRDETGYVVEGQNKAVIRGAAGAKAQATRVRAAGDVDLRLGAGGGMGGLFHQFREFRGEITQPLAVRGVGRQAEQGHGLAVDGGNTALAVEADHACADPGQNRLDELTPGLRLVTGGLERGLLSLKIGGHSIE